MSCATCIGGGSGQNRRPQESKPLPFKVGDKMMGTAHSVTGWGAFFDIGEGLRGLLHIDEMIWPEGNFAPSAHDCMKEGDQAEVRLPATTACGSLCLLFIL